MESTGAPDGGRTETSREEGDASGRSARTGPDRMVVAVIGIAALGLLARLVGLGDRPFHWDEARVGYWTLRYAASGTFEYRPVAGGPFLYVLNRHLFVGFAPTDFLARLAVAAIGGLLPLVALCFRGRLRDDETVVLAALLAANPVLLYYSRFLRGDVPLAAFGLATVGLAVRAADARSRRSLYAAGVAAGLALTTSGFAPGYVVCWVVAGAFVVDHAAVARVASDPDARVEAAARRLRTWATPLARAALAAVAVCLYFYAPRAGAGGGPGFYRPATWPAVFEGAVVGSVRKFAGVRIVSRWPDGTHPLLPYVTDLLDVLAAAALPLVALAAGAFLAERYRADGGRPVVAFHAYWGGAALLVVPAFAEVSAPWNAVHVVVPLAVPAAIGGARVIRLASRSIERQDAVAAGAALLLLTAALVQVGAVASGEVYGPSDPDHRLAQYAQPADDLGPFAANVSAVAAENDGVDVLYYGDRFYLIDQGGADRPPVADAWGNRLPLPWYTERAGVITGSVASPDELAALDERPPIVVADPGDRGELAPRLDGYEATEYELGLWNRRIVVFVEG